MKDISSLLRFSLAGLRLLLALTVVLGVGYPLLVTGVAQVAFPWQANGSLVTESGRRTTDPADWPNTTASGTPAAQATRGVTTVREVPVSSSAVSPTPSNCMGTNSTPAGDARGSSNWNGPVQGGTAQRHGRAR